MHKRCRPEASERPGPAETAATNELVADDGDKDHNHNSVSEEDIQLRAYRKWESEGKPTESGIRFWLEAEQELLQGR